MTLRNVWKQLALSMAAAGMVWVSTAHAQRINVFTENFESLQSKLGPADDEAAPQDPAIFDKTFSHTGPNGWSIDNSQMPTGGTTEWRGWSFANPEVWAGVYGQDRANFLFGTGGVIAVADSDSFDEPIGSGPGNFNSFLKTAPISVAGAAAGSLDISFDSSWRDEGTQTAVLTASYDGGAPIEIFRWESDSNSPNYKPAANPELFSTSLQNPAGAQSVVLNFGYTDARNNWWWAIDNININNAGNSIYTQDFESVALGKPVDLPVFLGDPEKLWTAEGPTGWTVDRTGVPGNGDDATDGVTEWAGWSFADKKWWTATAGDQQRSMFTKGQGIVAIADPDEWDDQTHNETDENGDPAWFKTGMKTPAIDISNLKAGTVELSFDHSWRPEFDNDYHQSGKIKVSYDGGAQVDVITWESVDDGGQKTRITTAGGQQSLTPGDLDLVNATETLKIANPEGAKTMQVEWYMYDAGNDWWWAVDNIAVSGEDKSVTFACGDFDKDSDVDSSDLATFLEGWTGAGGTGGTVDNGDCDADGDVDSGDLATFLENWTGALGAGLADVPAGVVGPSPVAKGAISAVPEPGSMVLVLTGLSLALLGRRRQS